MTEKWDYDPSKKSSEDIDRLIAQKPNATIADTLRDISAEEFSAEQLENFKKDRDHLILHVIMLQRNIDNLKKNLMEISKYDTAKVSLQHQVHTLEDECTIENNKITELETLLSKHTPLKK